MTNCKRYKASELEKLLSEGIGVMQDELKELRKDKERLDWLADPDNSVGSVMLPKYIVENNVHSLRDGIDQAMNTDWGDV